MSSQSGCPLMKWSVLPFCHSAITARDIEALIGAEHTVRSHRITFTRQRTGKVICKLLQYGLVMTEGKMDWREAGGFSGSALYLCIQPQEVVM